MKQKVKNFFVTVGVLGIFLAVFATFAVFKVKSEMKDREFYSLRFSNWVLEHHITEPVHEDFEKFLKQGARYYDKHVEKAQKAYDSNPNIQWNADN